MKKQVSALPMTRAEKSAQTRERIVEAAMLLLRQQGYEQVTVRNICGLAHVSNGTFYHFFESKDDLMGEYLNMSQKGFVADDKKIGLLNYIIEGYQYLADEYMKLGVTFTSNFYSPKNQAFNIHTRKPGNYMRDLYYQKLIEAHRTGYIRPECSIETVVHDIQVIVIGNVFEWCVLGGTTDLKSDLARMLHLYLETVFTDLYFKDYPKQ